MTIDPLLLAQARDAGAALENAERAVLIQRAEYHTAIRRLHLAGATLREIAEALSLSHQRVQQIVKESGGSWWRGGRARIKDHPLVCSWCQRPADEVNKLIAGPDVFICDRCVDEAEHAVRAIGGVKERCSFCRKHASRENPLVVGTAHHVCRTCLRTCREIIDHSSAI